MAASKLAMVTVQLSSLLTNRAFPSAVQTACRHPAPASSLRHAQHETNARSSERLCGAASWCSETVLYQRAE